MTSISFEKLLKKGWSELCQSDLLWFNALLNWDM